jgi:hypothetical protein
MKVLIVYVDWYNNGKKISTIKCYLKKDIPDKEIVCGIHDL